MTLAQLRPSVALSPEERYLQVLSESESGAWVLRLPPVLAAHQPELEELLGNVFSGRPSSHENLQLAKQLSLNWCISKCKKAGLTLDECFS